MNYTTDYTAIVENDCNQVRKLLFKFVKIFVRKSKSSIFKVTKIKN